MNLLRRFWRWLTRYEQNRWKKYVREYIDQLQWQDMQIEKLRGLLARVIAEDDSNVDTATCLSYELTDEIRAALQVSEGSTSSPQP